MISIWFPAKTNFPTSIDLGTALSNINNSRLGRLANGGRVGGKESRLDFFVVRIMYYAWSEVGKAPSPGLGHL